MGIISKTIYMPEGPEVRRSYEGLVREIGDGQITSITVRSGRYSRTGIPGMDRMALPALVIGGGVKGKLMWLNFDTGQTMLITLGMSGFWSASDHKHAHVSLTVDETKTIYYVDQRRFGTLKIIESGPELRKKIASLGLDLLNDDSIEFNDFRSRLMMGKNKPICETLMDQRIFAGVGNYIKCEALYEAKISPFTQTNVLNVPEMTRLFKSIQRIMKASYKQGGASIRNYQQVTGEPGEYVFSFSVYGQAKDPQGRIVIREKTSDGRTTHWVPSAQF
jgi:formamidopyrimidine-DNA glycosylase